MLLRHNATCAALTMTIEEDPTMLSEPTTERLDELGLIGMARALKEQRRQPDSQHLGFKDRLAMLVDREALERDSKSLAARLRFAGLHEPATLEDVNDHAARGLDSAATHSLFLVVLSDIIFNNSYFSIATSSLEKLPNEPARRSWRRISSGLKFLRQASSKARGQRTQAGHDKLIC
jgi:hypothetical protein